MSSTEVVTVTARGAARLRGGHPWVYAEDVARGDARGDVVRVVDGRGRSSGPRCGRRALDCRCG